jgi:ABC-type branched-subunit amino acid transport system substrate-binding protein
MTARAKGRALRWRALLLGVCLVSAACGARVPSALRERAARAALSSGGVNGQAGSSTDASGSVRGDLGASGAAAGAVGSSSGGTGGAAGAGGSSAGGAVGQPAPPGGNGGATDVGVTPNSILLGNVSDVTGPVPGIFQGAVLATQAYFNYVNSQGGLYGRQLKLLSADGQTDCGAAQNATRGLVDKVLGLSGSFEIYDDCESAVLSQYPNVPDVSYPVSKEHKELASNFSASPTPVGYLTGMFEYFKNKFGADATQNVGIVWNNVPAGAYSYRMMSAAAQAAGWKITYNRGIAPTETNFTADVVRMRNQGVKVFWTSFMTAATAASLVKAEQAQGWHPINIIPTAYDASFIKLMGSNEAAEGILGWNQWSLFFTPADATNIPEVALFQQWMQKTAPGTPLDLYAMHAWANTALFVKALRAVGPNVTRAKVMAYLRALTNYDGGGGFVAKASPGPKSQSTCYVIWVISKGEFVRQDTPASDYRCDGTYFNYKGN